MRAAAALLLVLTAAAPADRHVELSLTEARAQATGSAVSSLTARIADSEARTRTLGRRIARLNRQIAARESELARRQADIVPALAALESLSRRPPALLLLDPAHGTDAARTGLLVDAMLPGVRQRSAAIQAELAATRRLREQLVAAQAALTAAQKKLDRDVRALMRLGSLLASKAATLRELIDGVDSGSGAALRIALQRPAEGILATAFGAPGSTGMRASGLTLHTAADAPVVAPAAGRVAFTGPFRTYGPIVIIEHGGGVVTLIAGLAAIDVAPGDAVLPGQPIGRMGGTDTPRDLYLEVRAGGTPIDPAPWFVAR